MDKKNNYLKIVEIYFNSAMPQHWIAKTEEGYFYKFPARSEGWKFRELFDGKQANLNPVSSRTAQHIADTTGVPLK
jgi:hypothetical protein